MGKKKTRIELIDLAKAITIFLVILGHTAGNWDTPLYRRVLYSFHMPLFFFLAGLSIRPAPVTGRDGWRKFFHKNALALIVPYLIWGLIYAPFSFDNFSHLFYGSWAALGKMGTLTSLWYLSCFFIARILLQSVVSLLYAVKAEKISLYCGLCAVPMFAAAFLLPKLEYGYPWCFDVAFAAAGFMLLGIALRIPMLILAQQKNAVLCVVFGISTAVFLAGTVLRGDALDLSLMCGGIYGNVFWFLLNSFSGTLLVLSLSMLIARFAREGEHPFSLNAVTYIGQHTMGIFLLHKHMLQLLIMPFVRRTIPGPELLTAVIGSCIALAASMMLCWIIERYVPQLLGQFPRYESPAPSQKAVR